ncbi:hypothetical protein SNE40_000450 [Patella caerulea]|uniref:Uncharacterized protein n=1 Tax=Patella caerulea TaxID=87958 RepID=A0AAN8KAK3_PATCE
MNNAGTKVKRIWRGFLSDTSIHACHYLTHENKHVVSRLLWLLAVMTCFALLVMNLQILYTDYKQYNYRTKTSVIFDDKLEFPAISLCNSQSFNTSRMNRTSELYKFLYGKHMINISTNLYFSDPKWNSTIVTPWDLETAILTSYDTFLRVSHGPERLGRNSFQMSYKEPLKTCFTYNGQWKQKDLTPMTANEDDELEMYVDINQDLYAFQCLTAGISLCIHPPGEPLDSKTPCTVLSPGHAYQVELTVQDYTYLPHPYNSYQSGDCTETSHYSFKKTLKYFHGYSYRGCLLECLTDTVLEACGCITEYEVQNASNKYCTVRQRQECVSPLRRRFYKNTSYANNAMEWCNCPRPCSNVVYHQDLSSSFFPADSLIDFLKDMQFTSSLEHARSNLMRITISFKSLMVTHITHVPEYTLEDMISSMGGFMGFFVGASILSVLEVLDVVLRTITATIASYFKVEIVNKPKRVLPQTVLTM